MIASIDAEKAFDKTSVDGWKSFYSDKGYIPKSHSKQPISQQNIRRNSF